MGSKKIIRPQGWKEARNEGKEAEPEWAGLWRLAVCGWGNGWWKPATGEFVPR